MRYSFAFALAALQLFTQAVLAADTTLVATPSGAAHGTLVSGNLPVATGHATVGDSGKAPPSGAIVGTTDAQTLANKTISGAQNTLTGIPDSALSSNVDLMNAAQTATGLKTFSGGLALPSPSNPTGSNFYVDSNGSMHFVNSNYDAQLFGAKFSGDATRPWLTAPIGSGIAETSSGQQPNLQLNRNDNFNGGSGLDFNINAATALGKGVNTKTTADFAVGALSLTVTPNANIASGQNVYGPCVHSGTTVSSYSAGNVVFSAGLDCNIPNGSMLVFGGSSNTTPQNNTTAFQGTVNSFTQQTGVVQASVGSAGYTHKYAPSANIAEGGNFVSHDWTGRKSSIAGGGLTGAEFDVESSGSDAARAREAIRALVDRVTITPFGEQTDRRGGGAVLVDIEGPISRLLGLAGIVLNSVTQPDTTVEVVGMTGPPRASILIL